MLFYIGLFVVVGECSPVQVPGGPAKRGRRRSSAASGGQLNQLGGLQKDSKTTPAEDTPLLEATPDPPVSSRGRQRKINPKYIDDGDVAAMFYRKKR